MGRKGDQVYGLTQEAEADVVAAPELPYRPREPRSFRPRIALIGCGGVSEHHLAAYRKAGYDVAALCSRTIAKAEARRDEFFPEAEVYTDYRRILERDDVDVVDITTHPPERVQLTDDALRAGKHVLSQKPFVIDLDVGERLADLAGEMNVKLAVNQNGRWAPHFSYMRESIKAGLIGEPSTAVFEVDFNHNWVAGLVLDEIPHLLLYDFAIHWFDIAAAFFHPRRAVRVFASVARSKHQVAKPPLLGHALVDFEGGHATFAFNGDCRVGLRDRTNIIGAQGTLGSDGPDLLNQTVVLQTEAGRASPALSGKWFPDGMHGAMAELLCAVEEDREPLNSARNNLHSLEICFAAVASADSGRPVRPGDVRRLPSDESP